jgi:hypothetical protein
MNADKKVFGGWSLVFSRRPIPQSLVGDYHMPNTTRQKPSAAKYL